ncbi:hypothetical protein [Streptomyces sp. H27-D2]|uniref:hypothetical protein n=1 Tax=Streptomyces sp. H27-D2 TaxID=3046304 RepID=UPI002DBCE4D0|nr:hypothetical protein [Streptomyces sp. H27-D2]MEC4018286.1 hypothetical protein [Streptomyces sp. H27-D2]
MLLASRPALRRLSVAVAAMAAASVFTTTAAAAHANPAPAPVAATSNVTLSADDELPPLTPEEEKRAVDAAREIAELGLTEDEISAALEASISYPAVTDGLRDRLAELPGRPTAEQTAQAMYPGDADAQAAILPTLADEGARSSALLMLGESTGVTNPQAQFGWWDETVYLAKCGAAVGLFLLNFVPAGASVKAVRAFRLIKGYGAKKAASIIWRFVRGKNTTSKERRLVTALFGVSALSAACKR